jgi:hypothetical protein
MISALIKATLVAATFAVVACVQKESESKPELTPEQKAQALCEDRLAAFVMSKQFVKDRLKAPASSDFPWGIRSAGSR